MAATTALVLAGSTGAEGYSLRGSREKMIRQNTVAREDNFEFAQTREQVQQLVMGGELVPLNGSIYYTTKGVSFPYARPQVVSFVERLGWEYSTACGGQPLVITSLVRPIALQPRNASPLSVHPAGMAVDLHVPDPPACRSWLVDRLVTLASANVIEVTEEKHPHHLHIAVFPRAYVAWEAKQPRVPLAPGAQPAGPAQREVAATHRERAGGLTVPVGFGQSAATVAMTLGAMALAGAALLPLSRRGGRQRPEAHG